VFNPTYKLFAIPAPPDTWKAPVILLDESVVTNPIKVGLIFMDDALGPSNIAPPELLSKTHVLEFLYTKKLAPDNSTLNA
jgi:hypothetical protein